MISLLKMYRVTVLKEFIKVYKPFEGRKKQVKNGWKTLKFRISLSQVFLVTKLLNTKTEKPVLVRNKMQFLVLKVNSRVVKKSKNKSTLAIW